MDRTGESIPDMWKSVYEGLRRHLFKLNKRFVLNIRLLKVKRMQRDT